MKRIEINTTKSEKSEKKSANNNGFSFPHFSGSTNLNYLTNSTGLEDNIPEYSLQKKHNLYSINIDWLEFTCTWDTPIELSYLNHPNKRIIVEKISSHQNPNFRNLHRIYLEGDEFCDIYSGINNGTHNSNEVAIKITNAQLYTFDYPDKIIEVVNTFSLTYKRMSRLDIAIDGQDIMRLDTILNKNAKSHTVQVNNDAIKIVPTSFNKKELRWTAWSIGSRKSGLSARIYNKSEEIKKSNKKYIHQYWIRNNIATDKVGRFEVQLNYTRLKKIELDLNEFNKLLNAEFIGAIFINHVKPWFKLYRVKKKNFTEHKKEYAIKKGYEVTLVKWNHLPKKMELLKFCNHQSNASTTNAKLTISFTLREILKKPNTSTTAQVEIINKYAHDYCLQNYTKIKIRQLFGTKIKNNYKFLSDELDL